MTTSKDAVRKLGLSVAPFGPEEALLLLFLLQLPLAFDDERLLDHFHFHVLSCDSRQLYGHDDVGHRKGEGVSAQRA